MLNGMFDNSPFLLNPLAVQTTVVAMAITVLGIYTLLREHGSRVSAAFFLLTQSLGIWLFAFSRMYSAADVNLAMWWAKAAYVGICSIPAAVYNFTALVLQEHGRFKKHVLTVWILSGLFIALSLSTDIQFASLSRYSWGYFPKGGIRSLFFILYFLVVMAMALGSYVAGYRNVIRSTVQQRRSRILVIAFAVGSFGVVDFLVTFGVLRYPLGYAAIFLFTLISGYSILRYRFMPITAAFAARQIVDTMDGALIVVDPDGIIRLVNHATCALFRCREQDLVGKRPAGGPAGDPVFARTLESIVRGGAIGGHEMDCRDRNGSRRTLSLTVNAMRNPFGEPLATVCVISDITERKRAEGEREKMIEDLQKALAEIKTLRGFLPICYSCKKVRDDSGYWTQVEHYIEDHSEIQFSHGLCPECGQKKREEILEFQRKRKRNK